MPRRPRIHAPAGSYYVVQHGGAHRRVFSRPEDYSMLERLLAAALRRTGGVAHAYCWTPDAIHLVVRIDQVSIGRFMQAVTSRYARCINQRDSASGHFFATRYKATLIDAEAYLTKLVHYVHHLPVLLGLAPEPEAYAHTSHRAYLGVAQTPWLSAHAVLEAQSVEQGEGRRAYRELMTRAPSRSDIDLFRNGGQNPFRIIGGPEFIANLPRQVRPYRSALSIDQIIHTVARAQGVAPEHLASSSRKRELALARALVAWFAIERRVATLSAVARRLNRDPSTLSVAISRYRSARPELFRLNALHYLTPVGAGELRCASHDGAEYDDRQAAVG